MCHATVIEQAVYLIQHQRPKRANHWNQSCWFRQSKTLPFLKNGDRDLYPRPFISSWPMQRKFSALKFSQVLTCWSTITCAHFLANGTSKNCQYEIRSNPSPKVVTAQSGSRVLAGWTVNNLGWVRARRVEWTCLTPAKSSYGPIAKLSFINKHGKYYFAQHCNLCFVSLKIGTASLRTASCYHTFGHLLEISKAYADFERTARQSPY